MEALFLGMLNTPEIILILVLALILFGAKKLPELAKGLGHGIKEFRKASRDISDELNTAIYEEPKAPVKKPVSTEPLRPDGVQPQGEPDGVLSGEGSGESTVPQVEGSGGEDGQKSSGQSV